MSSNQPRVPSTLTNLASNPLSAGASLLRAPHARGPKAFTIPSTVIHDTISPPSAGDDNPPPPPSSPLSAKSIMETIRITINHGEDPWQLEELEKIEHLRTLSDHWNLEEPGKEVDGEELRLRIFQKWSDRNDKNPGQGWTFP